MRGFGFREALAILAVLAVVCTTGAAASGDGLTIEIDGDGDASVDDPNAAVVSGDHDPPDRYAWQLDLAEDYQTADVIIHDGFPIDRARQLKPMLDGKHFVEVDNVSDVDRPARVYNVSSGDTADRYELGLPGPGVANLTLERDVEAPAVEIVSIGNRTDIGFDVTTDTSEPALAELFVENRNGERVQNYPTPRPGPWQQFPVQGLDANTTYFVTVEVHDWSGNSAQTDRVEVTTKPSEDPIEPTVEPARPAPNATVSGGTLVVEASYEETGGWPIVEEDVAFFFDKERIDRSRLEVGNGTITFRPEGPFEPREYFVSVEVPNTAGGTGIARWSFHVEDEATQAAPGPLGLVPVVLAAGLLAVLRREP